MSKLVSNTYNGRPENVVVFTITKDIPHQLDEFYRYARTGDWKAARHVDYVALQKMGEIVLIGTFVRRLIPSCKDKRKFVFECENVKFTCQPYPTKYRGLQQSVKYGHYDAKTNTFYLDED